MTWRRSAPRRRLFPRQSNQPSKRRNPMNTKLILAVAGILSLSGTAVALADSVVITSDQAPEVHQYIVKQHVEAVTPPSDFQVEVGTVVPESVEIHTLDVPSLSKKYDYMVVNGQTVIVDPQTRKIVQVMQ